MPRRPSLAHGIAAILVIAAHGALISGWVDDSTPEPLGQAEPPDTELINVFLLPRQRPAPDAAPLPLGA